MKKVFVFCIGGTGIRVMKSITMLMAGGMDTNGYTVVPVILDPHLDLEEKKNLHSARQQNDLKKESDCPVFLYNVNYFLSLEALNSSDLCGNSKQQRL